MSKPNLQTYAVDFAASHNNASVPLAVRFTNKTTPTPIQPDSPSQPTWRWLWDFGDGTQDDEKDAVHQYTVPGTYTVRLSLVVSNGQVFTCSKPGCVVAKCGTGLLERQSAVRSTVLFGEPPPGR